MGKSSNKVRFHRYFALRSLSLSLGLAALLTLIAYLFTEDRATVKMLFVVLLLFAILTFAVHRSEYRRIEKALQRIAEALEGFDKKALERIEDLDAIEEYSQIRKALAKTIRRAKKREAKLTLRNRQRADMISAIAHEFRNPVASITGYAQTLHEESEIPEPMRARFFDKIYKNGMKIEQLLQRLSLWNRFERKETKPKLTTVSLHALASEIVASLSEHYQKREIAIEGEDRIIEADRTLMEIALSNLVENALKYSKESVRIVIEEDRICVIDKGIGIAPEELTQVTKKFYRSQRHKWDNSMGLGLAIVKRILKLHAFELHIESRPDEGSSFCILFK